MIDAKGEQERERNRPFEHFKLEYEQLCESYRHTYETIWNAGGVFTAISGGLVIFGAKEGVSSLSDVARYMWALPFLVWWLGIFIPMDWYGQLRQKRLEQLEEGEGLQHFKYIKCHRKPDRILCYPLYWVKVHYVVHVFGIGILIVWLALLPCWAILGHPGSLRLHW